MARRILPRLVLVALAVAALASCSDDEPEPVASNGGLELSSTTTEQPRITEPETTTTSRPATTTTTTSTTTTTTTTTAPAPAVPSAEELLGALPASEALSAGEWSRTEGPAEGAADPAPICDGSTVATPLSPLVYESAADGGVLARYERPDESSRVRLVIAPLADAAIRIAQAQTEVAGCATGADPLAVLPWPALGEGSVAYSRSEEGPIGDAAVPGGQIATWALAHVGPVVVALNVQSFWADGQELAPAPTEAELQAFLQTALDGVGALTGT